MAQAMASYRRLSARSPFSSANSVATSTPGSRRSTDSITNNNSSDQLLLRRSTDDELATSPVSGVSGVSGSGAGAVSSARSVSGGNIGGGAGGVELEVAGGGTIYEDEAKGKPARVITCCSAR